MTARQGAPSGRVLIVAGSDSGGGAGVQADVKTVVACGGHASTAVTALTVQNTLGVYGVHESPPDFIADQIMAVLSDIGADAVKIGMLHSAAAVRAAFDALAPLGPGAPLILDPVITSASGARLAPDAAVEESKRTLFLRASLITPNAPEAEVLTRLRIASVDDMRRAGERMLSFGCEAALIKGGHLCGDVVHDVLVTFEGHHVFESPRIAGDNNHGTGCTLASAIAALMARGAGLVEAVACARRYVHGAIANAPNIGAGSGPLDHAWLARKAFDDWRRETQT